jgi:hypothetical protein
VPVLVDEAESELAVEETEAVSEAEAAEVVELAASVVDDDAPGMGAAPMTGGGRSWGERFLIMRLTWLSWLRCCRGRSWLASTTVEVAMRRARAIKSVVESFRVNMAIK